MNLTKKRVKRLMKQKNQSKKRVKPNKKQKLRRSQNRTKRKRNNLNLRKNTLKKRVRRKKKKVGGAVQKGGIDSAKNPTYGIVVNTDGNEIYFNPKTGNKINGKKLSFPVLIQIDEIKNRYFRCKFRFN